MLQVAFGWTDSHPHEFEVRGVRYGQADPEFGMERFDEKRIPLEEVLRKSKDTMNYECGVDASGSEVLKTAGGGGSFQ